METEQCEECFEEVFVKYTKDFFVPKLLLMDGHASHFTIKLIEIADSNNIHIICMPAHSTHLLEPLDVGVFKHFKASWRKTLQNYYFTNSGQSVSKSNIAEILKNCLGKDNPFSRAHAVGALKVPECFL